MLISRIEFDDPDDPESACNTGEVRLSFAPEAMVIVLPNGKELTHDDQVELGKLLRMCYEQGKKVGKNLNARH